VGSRFRGRTSSKVVCITLSPAKAAIKRCQRLSLRITGKFNVRIDKSTATYAVQSYTTGTEKSTARTLVQPSVFHVPALRWVASTRANERISKFTPEDALLRNSDPTWMHRNKEWTSRSLPRRPSTASSRSWKLDSTRCKTSFLPISQVHQTTPAQRR
jgi:hypothetical protein